MRASGLISWLHHTMTLWDGESHAPGIPCACTCREVAGGCRPATSLKGMGRSARHRHVRMKNAMYKDPHAVLLYVIVVCWMPVLDAGALNIATCITRINE